MKLYSIRHKISGKFYTGDSRWIYSETGELWGDINWSDSPTFYKTIDGVAKALKRIGCELICHAPRRGKLFKNRSELKKLYYLVHDFKCFDNFEISKLENIEVIVTNVSVLGEESFPASKFINAEELVK